jgi:hypothetical protein
MHHYQYVLKGKSLKSISDCVINARAIVSTTPITYLGFVCARTGRILESNHPLYGRKIGAKIFVYPRAVGSTVAPYVMLNLKKYGCAPAAIINRESDSGTVSGASIAKIPLVYKLNKDPLEYITNDMRITIKIKGGRAEVII